MFLFTIIQGGILIITSEKAQQQKEKMAVSQLTFAGECGSDHKGCENKEESRTVTCWNGEVKHCTFQTKFSYDPCADDPNANGACGRNYSPPACTQCGEQIIGDCNCPPPPPPPSTPTPKPTSTPTPTPTQTPTPTPTSTPTPTPISPPSSTPSPTPTSTPSPTPTPLIGTLACGAKGCKDNSNPCIAGLVCINGPTDNYCSLPQLTTQCKQNGTYDSCCNAGGGGTLTCGQKGCSDSNNPCQSGLTCVQSTDANYCALPALQTSCKSSPVFSNCCTLPTTPTTTQVIAQQVLKPTLPQTGDNRKWYLVPATLILFGLLF